MAYEVARRRAHRSLVAAFVKRKPEPLKNPTTIFCENYWDYVEVEQLFLTNTHYGRIAFDSFSVTENILSCHSLTKMKPCHFEYCLSAKAALAQVAPGPHGNQELSFLREWLLQTLACWATVRFHPVQMAKPLQKFSLDSSGAVQASFLPDMVVYYCTKVLGSLDEMIVWQNGLVQVRNSGFKLRDDLFYVVELLLWVSNATDFVPNPRSFRSHYGLSSPTDISTSHHSERFRVSTQDLQELRGKYCKRRIWSLVHACRIGSSVLPSIVSMLKKMPGSDYRTHEKCTQQFCEYDKKDTTAVSALHVCSRASRDHLMTFDTSILNRSTLPYNAWDRSQNLTRDKFMTISHVWLDGTGYTSENGPGTVNRCLFDLFITAASCYGCPGIWWDAICMPSDPEKRSNEIRRMHQNYSKSEFTLVYDRQLAAFEWRGDGSPCLALVLSAWFTRGWTALELRASRRVKVLFKAPRNIPATSRYDIPHLMRPYVIKDLDEDILTGEKNLFAHAAHREASLIIQAVRGKVKMGLTKLNQLLYPLKYRHTSRATDRMITASLMVNQDGRNVSLASHEITKRLLAIEVQRITPHSLFHKGVITSGLENWSWCPPSLLDLEEDEEGYDYFLDISLEGELKGKWNTKQFTKAELEKLSPVSSSNAISNHIKARLKSPNDIIVLDKRFMEREKTNNGVAHDSYLLVSKPDKNQRCSYIGVVKGTLKWTPSKECSDQIIIMR